MNNEDWLDKEFGKQNFAFDPNKFKPFHRTIKEYESQNHQIELLSFGVKFLDDAMIGIYPSDLVLFGAPTGAGKTQFCVNCIMANVNRGKKVHMIALEAEKAEIENFYLSQKEYSFLQETYIDLFWDFEKNELSQFQEIWKSWIEYRKQNKMPYVYNTQYLQLKKLSQFPLQEAINMIEASIENGWQGLFPKKEKNSSPTQGRVFWE